MSVDLPADRSPRNTRCWLIDADDDEDEEEEEDSVAVPSAGLSALLLVVLLLLWRESLDNLAQISSTSMLAAAFDRDISLSLLTLSYTF